MDMAREQWEPYLSNLLVQLSLLSPQFLLPSPDLFLGRRPVQESVYGLHRHRGIVVSQKRGSRDDALAPDKRPSTFSTN